MIDRLESNIEIRAEKAANLAFCNGINLLKIKQTVAEMLDHIGKCEIFEEYTVHNISHINEMLEIAEWLIPDKTKEIMTPAEWLMLTLAIYFHDLGMVVSKSEYDNRSSNTLFMDYKKVAVNQNSPYADDEKYLYQEYVRENHAKRIRTWIEGKDCEKYGHAKAQIEILISELSCLSKRFKDDLAMICESHHLDDIDRFDKYKIQSIYANGNDSVINLNYIAIILRCADLLHITNDRTPTITYSLINVSNPTSIIEWQKQRAVEAIVPKQERNSEGNIDSTIEKNTIQIMAYFANSGTAEAYFGLTSYLKYAEKELIVCNKIAEDAKRQEGSRYDFPWKKIDSSNITTSGFETKKLSFALEQDNILKLLIGHTLYNDSSVVVRELTQNAIDAIKLQKYIDQKKGTTSTAGKILERI